MEAIARDLHRMPRLIAAHQMERLGGSTIAREQLALLAGRVRTDAWVRKTLAGATSRRWWKRLDAARLIPMVYEQGDREVLGALIADDHPAVAAAAIAGIAAHADAQLVHTIVRRLPGVPPTLRMQQMHGLKHHSEIVSPLLVQMLGQDLTPPEVQVMVQLGELVATPQVFTAIVNLSAHPCAEVRAAVARALRSAFVPGAAQAARFLLNDSDWHVRAAAARAIEGLLVTNAVAALKQALSDEEWWVRFRAAGALASLGEPGAVALEEVIVSDDPYASEMAIAIGGLSPANLLDVSG